MSQKRNHSWKTHNFAKQLSKIRLKLRTLEGVVFTAKPVFLSWVDRQLTSSCKLIRARWWFFVSLACRDGDFPLSCWCYRHKTIQNLKWRREILFCGHVVHGRRHTGELCVIRCWRNLVWTDWICWSNILLHACSFSKSRRWMHRTVQRAIVDEIADVVLDYAVTYPLVMWNNSLLNASGFTPFYPCCHPCFGCSSDVFGGCGFQVLVFISEISSFDTGGKRTWSTAIVPVFCWTKWRFSTVEILAYYKCHTVQWYFSRVVVASFCSSCEAINVLNFIWTCQHIHKRTSLDRWHKHLCHRIKEITTVF